MTRREYPIRLTINGRRIIKVVIDPHYEVNHSSSINDAVILELVELLTGSSFEPEMELGNFQYFVSDNLVRSSKRYKLIWLLEKNALYIGVINAYRRR
ncbi:MAG: hypothetical protein AABZ06_04595 [Bdellovibrionota bacterium]